MIRWRFYPLQDFPKTGLLLRDEYADGERTDRKPFPAQFFTLTAAKKLSEEKRLKGSPPTPGGAAGEEPPTPKAADAEGGAVARLVSAPPKPETVSERQREETPRSVGCSEGGSGEGKPILAEAVPTFSKCGHLKTPENTKIVGRYRSPTCDQCWRAALRAGQQRRQERKRQMLEAPLRPFEVEPAHYAPADREQQVTQRKIAASRRANTQQARDRIEKGLPPSGAKSASVRHAQFAIEEENRLKERLADPVEQAKHALRKRYTPVLNAETMDGPAGHYIVGRRTVSKDELLAMAARAA